MATSEQISDFLTYVTYAQSTFMDKLNLKERLGHENLFKWRLQNVILGYYIQILVDYFAQAEYDSGNFCTTDEIQDVIDRVNRLCDSNYTIEL
jgi:hypothetical protein